MFVGNIQAFSVETLSVIINFWTIDSTNDGKRTYLIDGKIVSEEEYRAAEKRENLNGMHYNKKIIEPQEVYPLQTRAIPKEHKWILHKWFCLLFDESSGRLVRWEQMPVYLEK